jgi:hypothetical protein
VQDIDCDAKAVGTIYEVGVAAYAPHVYGTVWQVHGFLDVDVPDALTHLMVQHDASALLRALRDQVSPAHFTLAFFEPRAGYAQGEVVFTIDRFTVQHHLDCTTPTTNDFPALAWEYWTP